MPNGEHGDVFDRTPNKSRIKTKTEREKCSNVQMFTGTIFPHTGAYIIYIGGFYIPRSSPFTPTPDFRWVIVDIDIACISCTIGRGYLLYNNVRACMWKNGASEHLNI